MKRNNKLEAFLANNHNLVLTLSTLVPFFLAIYIMYQFL